MVEDGQQMVDVLPGHISNSALLQDLKGQLSEHDIIPGVLAHSISSLMTQSHSPSFDPICIR